MTLIIKDIILIRAGIFTFFIDLKTLVLIIVILKNT